MKKESSSEFHPELYALSLGAHVMAQTYTGCIVNGVRFMVASRDTKRATQNSGVMVEGENGEKYYGVLEEIIEIGYPRGYTTVLFRCKWYDTRVTVGNNITSISTEHEWDKEDQLIFARQAKQVFYIQEPSRGKQNNKHRWVVENVNHRQIWDRPPQLENVQNVDTELGEDVDVVHNNSSSNIGLIIDFHQYFQNISSHATPGENAMEVDAPSNDDSEVADAGTYYDDDDPDYDDMGSD